MILLLLLTVWYLKCLSSHVFFFVVVSIRIAVMIVSGVHKNFGTENGGVFFHWNTFTSRRKYETFYLRCCRDTVGYDWYCKRIHKYFPATPPPSPLSTTDDYTMNTGATQRQQNCCKNIAWSPNNNNNTNKPFFCCCCSWYSWEIESGATGKGRSPSVTQSKRVNGPTSLFHILSAPNSITKGFTHLSYVSH